MARKYEHISTGDGYYVENAGVKTQVIAQDGTIKTPVVTTNLTTTGNTILGDSASDTVTVSGRIISNAMPAGYTTPTLGVGVYGTPVVDTTLIDNIAFTSNMSTGTNKTAADSSSMAAFFGMKNTAATANNKLQSVLASTSVYYNCFDAYGVQGHVAVKGDASSDGGTGNIVGVSAKVTVDSGKTMTGTVSGLLVTADGAGTVTGAHSGVWIDNVAATDQAILITGSNKLGINMNGISISAGTATDDAGIKTAQGATAPAGSIYISTNGTVFVMVSTTWTALTIN